MKTTLIPASVGFPKGGAPRSPGIHLSRIIRSIAFETGVLKPEWIDDLSLIEANQEEWWEGLDEASKLRMSIGLAWENWYLPQLGHVVHQPGEMCVDGIYMTHDGESLDVITHDTVWDHNTQKFELALHEVKATYKSTKTVGDDLTAIDNKGRLRNWLWLTQTKGYCKGMGTMVAYLHVLFLCGDYKYPLQPRLRCWRIDYTQEEIDDNWQLMADYVRERQWQERTEDYGQEGR